MELETFVSHLSGNLSLDDNIHVTFENDKVPRSELAVSLPLVHESLGQLIPVSYFFEKLVAVLAQISMESLQALAELASGKEKSNLTTLGKNKDDYEQMTRITGLKWLDLFKIFPSLSGQVSIWFLLCSMKKNHPRSYSIASCKAVVGSQLHLCVGRYLYSRGGAKMDRGICSNFLTNVNPGK